jgi:hypothetical protein
MTERSASFLSPPITALILRVGGRLASCNIRFIVHRSRGISRPTAFQIARQCQVRILGPSSRSLGFALATGDVSPKNRGKRPVQPVLRSVLT